MNKLEFCSNS